jgi:ubiquinone/menaquinone biosynthesis C-methylase UbiE
LTDRYDFDPFWEEKYAGGHAQRYPWDVVVSFVFRNAPAGKSRQNIRILEVGCGTASNLWFAAREGFDVYGIDGSASAINYARKRFAGEQLQGDLRVSTFTEIPFESAMFDLVIDRAAITCVDRRAACRAIAEVHRVLSPGGRFLFNPYSDDSASAFSGRSVGDGLIVDIAAGSLVGAGQICFYNRTQILQALEAFDIKSLQHVEYEEATAAEKNIHAEWRAVAEKRR